MAILKNGIVLILALACAGVVFGGGAGETASERAGFTNPELLISVDELAEAQGSKRLLVIDARKPDDYAAGHIPGAVNLPTSEIEETVNVGGADARFIVKSPEDVAPILQDAGISKNTRVVIYDDGGSTRATRLWWVLDYYGHTKAAVLNGGLAAWSQAGQELGSEISNVEPGNFQPVADESKIASYEYVKANLNSMSTAVCDALSEDSYKKGAIESAINLPFSGFYSEGETPLLHSAAELAGVMESRGLSKDNEVIFYCGAGYAASVNYFVARALGFTNVRLYDGSKADWTARGEQLLASGRS